MRRNTHKKFNGKNVFTDFKHHARSWHNSKRLRSRMLRQELKRNSKQEEEMADEAKDMAYCFTIVKDCEDCNRYPYCTSEYFEHQLNFNPNPNPSREEYCKACRDSAKEGPYDE